MSGMHFSGPSDWCAARLNTYPEDNCCDDDYFDFYEAYEQARPCASMRVLRCHRKQEGQRHGRVAASAARAGVSDAMKALSIRQPWAWLIVHGYKDIENRSWRTSYRGPLLIHAGKSMTRAEYENCLFDIEDHPLLEHLAARLPPPKELPRGGIVGEPTSWAACGGTHRPGSMAA